MEIHSPCATDCGMALQGNFPSHTRTDSAYTTALHAEMREGLLAESTDYASKPLRDQLKRM